MSIELKKLSEPFPTDMIHWRVGSVKKDKSAAMALAYLDARDVMDRLDSVVGPENWQSKHEWSDGKKLECSIGVKLNDCWVWKSNGAGDTSFEADKGAFSDAFKRAAVLWGIGRYLYQTPNWWEPINEYKQFTDMAKKNLKDKMKAWLNKEQGKDLFDYYSQKHKASIDAVISCISSNDLSSAAEAWVEIPEDEQKYLWLAKTKGGVFDQEHKKIMYSTAFRV